MDFLADVWVTCPVCQGAPLQARNARGALQGEDDRRNPRDGRARGSRALQEHSEHHDALTNAARCRPRLHQAGAAVADALRRRGAANQTGPRTGQAVHGPHALSPGRADDRAAFRRHSEVVGGAARVCRCGQYGGRGRAQSRCDQNGRLDHRPGARRRLRRRPDRNRRHAGRRRRVSRILHRPGPSRGSPRHSLGHDRDA